MKINTKSHHLKLESLHRASSRLQTISLSPTNFTISHLDTSLKENQDKFVCLSPPPKVEPAEQYIRKIKTQSNKSYIQPQVTRSFNNFLIRKREREYNLSKQIVLNGDVSSRAIEKALRQPPKLSQIENKGRTDILKLMGFLLNSKQYKPKSRFHQILNNPQNYQEKTINTTQIVQQLLQR